MNNFNFYIETQFKQTEIGEIPEDWEVVRLGIYDLRLSIDI